MRIKKDSSDHRRLLGGLLKSVSRSFYLTLRVLPAKMRDPVGLAYLLARAADTIADTELLPPGERLDLLLSFRAQVNGSGPGSGTAGESELRRIAAATGGQQSNPHERALLQSLVPAVGLLETLDAPDRADVRSVVTTLSTGMELDLATFPLESSGQLAALKTREELEQYTYLVAGCVGPFWTRMSMRHLAALRGRDETEMCARGIRFGKALQYTNVLRDAPKDLRIGRCYFPLEVLSAHGLQPQDLLQLENSLRARPALYDLIRVTLEHYQEAQRYVLAIPPRCARLRLACLWPVLIGLATLEKLAANAEWLDPAQPSKVSRAFVKRTMAFSLPAVVSDTLVKLWIEKTASGVRREINDKWQMNNDK